VVIASVADLRFDADGLIPAIAQDAENGQVLMHAYMNREALARTLETGLAHYYSRSRGRLWRKGEESGNLQRVRRILYDCDADTLLLLVDQTLAACHTGNRSCFYRGLSAAGEAESGILPPAWEAGDGIGILDRLFAIIRERKATLPEDSYVAGLFAKGPNAILKKIGEEAAEVVMAGKDRDRQAIIFEVADLWFHTLVLLGLHDIEPREVAQELRSRIGKRRRPA
jgi:phosphoribosyl-ATP pyrophosphohydrolase/phosphoribosyl-AMP cyclohydrolase